MQTKFSFQQTKTHSNLIKTNFFKLKNPHLKCHNHNNARLTTPTLSKTNTAVSKKLLIDKGFQITIIVEIEDELLK